MLTQSQKNKLSSVRSDFKQIGVALWTITKNSVDSTDIYGRAVTLTTGSRFFSGSVAWSSTVMRLDSTGGYYKTSDVNIIVSFNEKDYIDKENCYLVCEGVKLRMKDFSQATDTNEMVIHCERLDS